ncbi:MAG: glycosyltransferase [Granulicella sp.]
MLRSAEYGNLTLADKKDAPCLLAEPIGSQSQDSRSRWPTKPQILHLIGSSGVGGPEKQILHHAVNIQDSAYEIHVGSFHEDANQPEILLEAERRHLKTICLDGGMHPRIAMQLARFLRERKIALLCTHGFKANVLGYLVSLHSKTQHVAFLRGWTAETARVVLYEKLERRALARAQNVVCVSRLQAEQVRKLRGSRSAPLVIENAMLPPFVRESNKARPTRDSLAIPNDAFLFGSVGRLSAEKGHRFLLLAFAEVCRATPPGQTPYLLIVGDGREREPLEQLATQLGVQQSIHFAGFQGDCADWLKMMDCMVQPSLTEGTPNSILEAMCLGVPVVATQVGGVPALIHNGVNGMLVPPSDASSLAKMMRTVANQPALRTSLAIAATNTGGEYAPTTQRANLLKLYDGLALPSMDMMH